jgi:hypothetical protein
MEVFFLFDDLIITYSSLPPVLPPQKQPAAVTPVVELVEECFLSLGCSAFVGRKRNHEYVGKAVVSLDQALSAKRRTLRRNSERVPLAVRGVSQSPSFPPFGMKPGAV